MSLPEIVEATLGEESVAARVSLGGEDELLVTPTRTLVYRAEGLLADESVEEYPHGAERVEITEGRRKSKLTLDYGLDGERTLSVPTKRLDDVLHPILAGVLNDAGITDPGETVKQTFRFSELTIVVTSDRLVKHIGTAVWDEDYEEFHYGDLTDLTFEDGSVATSVVLTLQTRQERFKAPNDQARVIKETITNAVLAYHDADSLDALREQLAPDEETDSGETEVEADAGVAFGGGLDPLSTTSDGGSTSSSDEQSDGSRATEAVTATDEPVDTVEPDAGFDDSEFEASDATDGAVADELAALRAAVEEQNERLDRHEELVRTLIEELRQGR